MNSKLTIIRAKSRLVWVAILVAIITVPTACGHHRRPVARTTQTKVLVKDNKTEAGDTIRSEISYMVERIAVIDRVRSIYELVRAYYLTQGGVTDNDLLDKAYCSMSWNKLLLQVRAKEGQTGHLFYEINPWSMTIDGGKNISYDDFEVTHIIKGDPMRASVTFTVYEADTYTPARVDLVFEDGRWVIDNFYNLKYQMDVRNCMWEFLAKDLL